LRLRRARPPRWSADRSDPHLHHERALALLNLVAAVVYALAMPFVALVTAYVYFDARTRVELEPFVRVLELPAELELA
jgi:hypothetical protein